MASNFVDPGRLYISAVERSEDDVDLSKLHPLEEDVKAASKCAYDRCYCTDHVRLNQTTHVLLRKDDIVDDLVSDLAVPAAAARRKVSHEAKNMAISNREDMREPVISDRWPRWPKRPL